MHPIHYSLILGALALIGGAVLALVLHEPLLFVIALIVTYLLGGQTVGRFEGDMGEDNLDDPGYGRTSAGFVRDE